MRLKIVPLPTEIVETVRATMKSTGYGFPAYRQPPGKGRAPCRHCLKLIEDEELILFTYDAFYGLGVPPLPGPVYIHAEVCFPFGGDGRLPGAPPCCGRGRWKIGWPRTGARGAIGGFDT